MLLTLRQVIGDDSWLSTRLYKSNNISSTLFKALFQTHDVPKKDFMAFPRIFGVILSLFRLMFLRGVFPVLHTGVYTDKRKESHSTT